MPLLEPLGSKHFRTSERCPQVSLVGLMRAATGKNFEKPPDCKAPAGLHWGGLEKEILLDTRAMENPTIQEMMATKRKRRTAGMSKCPRHVLPSGA